MWYIQQNEFDALKKALVMQPILRVADFPQSFILHVNASNDRLGAVLLQEQEKSCGLWQQKA